MEQNDRSEISVYLVLTIAIALVVFALSYLSGGQIIASFNRAALTFMILSIPLVLYKSRKEKKSSGLNEDEYLLKQVGGADILFLDASNCRLFGWFLVFLPVLFALATFLMSHSFEDVVVPALILVAILWPFAWWFFRIAAKHRRIAEQAGTMFSSNKAHCVHPTDPPSAK